MRFLQFLFAFLVSIVFFDKVHAGNQNPWEEVFVLDCNGGIQILPSHNFGNIQLKVSALEPAVTYIGNWFEKISKCRCPNLNSNADAVKRGFRPGFQTLLLALQNQTDYPSTTYDNLCPGLFHDAFSSLKIGQLNLPSTCTVESYLAGNPCNVALQWDFFNMDVQFSVQECPGKTHPFISVSLLGNLTRDFLQPCTQDSDCQGGSICHDLGDIVEDIRDFMHDISLIDRNRTCASFGPNPEDIAQGVIDQVMLWWSQFVFGQSNSDDLKVCGGDYIQDIVDGADPNPIPDCQTFDPNDYDKIVMYSDWSGSSSTCVQNYGSKYRPNECNCYTYISNEETRYGCTRVSDNSTHYFYQTFDSTSPCGGSPNSDYAFPKNTCTNFTMWNSYVSFEFEERNQWFNPNVIEPTWNYAECPNIKSWNGVMQSGTAANAANRRDGSAFPAFPSPDMSSGSFPLIEFDCANNLLLLAKTPTSILLNVPSFHELVNKVHQEFRNISDCRTNPQQLSLPQFRGNFELFHMIDFLLRSLTVYDANTIDWGLINDGNLTTWQWFHNDALNLNETANDHKRLALPSGCSANTYYDNQECKLMYIGFSTLFAPHDVKLRLEIRRCGSPLTESLPSFKLDCIGSGCHRVFNVFSPFKLCTQDSDCCTNGAGKCSAGSAESRECNLFDFGANPPITPDTYEYCFPNFMWNSTRNDACCGLNSFSIDFVNFILAGTKQPGFNFLDSSKTYGMCQFDLEYFLDEERVDPWFDGEKVETTTTVSLNGFREYQDIDCSPGYYGANCENQCPDCAQGVCRSGRTSDGSCLCNAGWATDGDGKCTICAPGFAMQDAQCVISGATASQVQVKVTVYLTGDIAALGDLNVYKQTLVNDIAAALGISASRVEVLLVAPGSVAVQFIIKPPTNPDEPDSVTAYQNLVQQLNDPLSSIRNSGSLSNYDASRSVSVEYSVPEEPDTPSGSIRTALTTSSILIWLLIAKVMLVIKQW